MSRRACTATRATSASTISSSRAPTASAKAYARTKLYNVLFTRELARRLAGSGVTANALHPGMIQTEIGKNGDLRGIAGLVWPLLQRLNGRPIEEASRMPVHLATAPELEGVTGKYFTTGRAAEPSRLAQDDAAAQTAVGDERAAGVLPSNEVTMPKRCGRF